MFVEISPRGSGKTTRLIKNVIEFLIDNPDKTALIVTPYRDNRRKILSHIHEECERCFNRVITSNKMLPGGGNTMKQFVDEFGYMRCDDLIVDKNAYYTSSFNPDSMGDNVWNVGKEIIEYYRLTELNIVPLKILKRHKL